MNGLKSKLMKPESYKLIQTKKKKINTRLNQN